MLPLTAANVINETILHIDDEVKGDFSDVYDPGLLWLAAPYYVKTYGYDIIPELNWDDDEYDGPDLPKGEYIIFCPLTDAQYNLERNMSQELVESMFVWAMKQPNRKMRQMEYEVTKDIYDYWK